MAQDIRRPPVHADRTSRLQWNPRLSGEAVVVGGRRQVARMCRARSTTGTSII